ncbi:MAG: DUF1638 domain-containing protein [Pseudomonadota bacterium]
MLPVDDSLTADGLDLAGSAGAGLADRVLLIACGALAREVLALIRQSGLSSMDLTCLPALLHNRPDQIADAVRQRIHEGRAKGYHRIAVLYADCGTGGGLDRVCDEEGVARIPGPHCYAFFEGLEDFEARADEEIGAFYLTDFLVRQFDAIVWRGLGLDRHPDLRDMYFGNYDRVVYLAQTDDPDLDAAAKVAAGRLGLGYLRRFTGYGGLGAALSRAGGRSACDD